MANWTKEPQPFGPNRQPLLEGLSALDGVTPVPVAVDPTTGSILTSGGGSGGGGTQYTQGGPTVTNPTGNSLIYFNGSNQPIAVTTANPLPITGTISVGSTTDESAFTAGTSTLSPSGGVFNDSVASLTSGQQGTVRMTAPRAIHSNLRNNTGTEIATASNPLRTDPTGSTTQPVSISGTLPVNMTQLNGVASSVGNGTTDTGTQRVTLSSDSTGQVKLATGANAIGSITNTSFAATQATAASLNATVVGTGTFAVQSTDAASSATGSTVPTKAMYKGLLAQTANPTAATAGNLVGALADKLGKQVVVGSIRDLKVQQTTTITASTSETTVLTAVTSTFLDVYGVIIANSSATAETVTFKDATAGTTRFTITIPAGDTRGFTLPESGGYNQSAVNNNWTATCGTSLTSIFITMLAVKNI